MTKIPYFFSFCLKKREKKIRGLTKTSPSPKKVQRRGKNTLRKSINISIRHKFVAHKGRNIPHNTKPIIYGNSHPLAHTMSSYIQLSRNPFKITNRKKPSQRYKPLIDRSIKPNRTMIFFTEEHP